MSSQNPINGSEDQGFNRCSSDHYSAKWDIVFVCSALEKKPLLSCFSFETSFFLSLFLQILVEQESYVRTIILNRPQQLNALSFYMVCKLGELFTAYEEDYNVKLVILKGKGRSFCAGGDVAYIVRDTIAGGWKSGAKYFWNEYRMNYLLATYKKPQVSILNGFVMGGGAGVSVHGQFRVATENSIMDMAYFVFVLLIVFVEQPRTNSSFNEVFAMPETAIGLYPDVGGSYFLSRLPGFFGEYLGLTGERLDGAEMLACGLATHFVPAKNLLAMEEALCKVTTSDPAVVSTILDKFSVQPHLKEKSAYHRIEVVDRCFSRRTIEEILAALEIEALNSSDDWIIAAIQSIKKASPLSLKLSLKQIRKGRLQGIGQCLIMEYRLGCHAVERKLSNDFFEGCRAKLIDKDGSPKWQPSRLELIQDEIVDQFFAKMDDQEWEDLKLPRRDNLPALAMAKL
ncbi:Enoyl-CoA hydratase/isomerase domain [Dillenia turbinata]|uniref:3-hydroxyisobutyryl-CoA hydrolase n=1 Tax=Dillenia turbinata TaxID=194707 RepID=A0AAN8VS06_9MAGN